jgi:hypothetical protein
MAFQKLRGGLTANISPATGAELEGAAARLRKLLKSSAMLAQVEVETTDDPDQLLIAMVRYLPGMSAPEVAGYLEKSWLSELRYLGWDAFSLLVEDGHVELEAATMDGDASHFVTVHLVASEGVPADFEAPAVVPSEWVSAPKPARRWTHRLLGV